MSRFFVGQRVKKVRSEHSPPLGIGREGRITSIGSFRKGDLSWDGKFFAADSDCTISSDGKDCSSRLYLWEPITDEHQPCESEFKELLDKLLEAAAA